MTYTPTKAIINAGVIPENLMTWIIAQQAGAITWAGGTSYKTLQKYSSSVLDRATPVFPAIAFDDDEDDQDFTQDVIDSAYETTFEVSIQNASPDTAVTQAKIYRKAICSLILNCPDATLIANTGALSGAVLIKMRTKFSPIKTNEAQNDFLQQFKIGVTYLLSASSH
jgi:hypothetical protein